MRTEDLFERERSLIHRIEMYALFRGLSPVEDRFVARALSLDFDTRGTLLPRNQNGEIIHEALYRAARLLAEVSPSPEIEQKIQEEAELVGHTPTQH